LSIRSREIRRVVIGYVWSDRWSKNSRLSCRSKSVDKVFQYLSCRSYREVDRYRTPRLWMSMRGAK